MRTALAPQWPRLASWTWAWLALGLLLGSQAAFSQTTKGGDPAPPKGGATKAPGADEAAKKDKDAPEKKGAVEAKPKRKVEPAETFDDPRTKNAAAKIRELFPNARLQPNDEAQFEAMSSGAVAVDRDLITRYVRYQVYELTRRSNIAALADLSASALPSRRIAEATEKLVKPFLIPAGPQTESFRRAYVPELVSVTQKEQLLQNHLYARNAIMIVLKESADAAAFPIYQDRGSSIPNR